MRYSKSMMLIEMAFDLDTWQPEDPHDPEFQAAMAGKKVIVYFGASTKKFWDYVRNGFKGAPIMRKRQRVSENAFFLELREAIHSADHAASLDGGEPIVFVLEAPVMALPTGGKTEQDQLRAFVQRSGATLGAPFIEPDLPPKYITGVVYPAMMETWETPIRKFINDAKVGLIDGIEPSYQEVGGRFSRATMPEWQEDVLRYLSDLLNYSTQWFHYLTEDQAQFYTKVLKALGPVDDATYWRMQNWTGPDWVKWLEGVLGEKLPAEDNLWDYMENPAHQPYHGFHLPFWKVRRKYQDPGGFMQTRLGKKPPESR